MIGPEQSVRRLLVIHAKERETKAELLERLAWSLRNGMPAGDVADQLDDLARAEREVATSTINTLERRQQ